MKHTIFLRSLGTLSLLLFSLLIVAQPDADMPTDDQQILDDLIVDGSICAGQDCANGESFGFDTLRLKENNLRIRAFDTSTSASFPSRDWQITFNDSSNGGMNKFSIDDIDGGRTPFTIEAGAPSHSLYVDDGGRIGLGTSTPVADIHVKSGNTPTLRLEQDGTSGFTPQIWDLAGNEANFFIRDATNGSTLPFRVYPGAPSNALTIEATTGDVGIGTTSPDANLDIEDNEGGAASPLLRVINTNAIGNSEPALWVQADSKVGIGTQTPGGALEVRSAGGAGAWAMRLAKQSDGLLLAGVIESGTNDGELYVYDAAQTNTVGLLANGASFIIGDLGIGRYAPTQKLHVEGNILHSGTIMMSDRRLKSNINSLDKGLDELLRLNPVTYNYNGQAGITSERTHIGLVAQDLNKVVPELVSEVEQFGRNDDGSTKSYGKYLQFTESELKYLIINAIKDQQEIIEDQRLNMIDLKQDNLELREMVLDLTEKIENIKFDDVTIDNADNFHLGQNSPNPFDGTTQIKYFVPELSKSASLHVFNLDGKLLKEIPITSKGNGVVSIHADALPQGAYTYSLFIDSQIVDTKKMILSR